MINQAGITPELKAESPNAAPLFMQGHGDRQQPLKTEKLVPPGEISQRFLDIDMYKKQPLRRALSGLGVEYRVVMLYSRDAGKREADIGFNVGQGTQDLGFRSSVPILFNCLPAAKVVLGVKDFDGQPTSGSFVVRDKLERVYPNRARRLAPDFFFHNQVYRADGESLLLPPGDYSVEYTRGPEYLLEHTTLHVKPDVPTQTAEFQLKRWIHPAERHWYSGDHHVHAAGCAHYDSPTEGVTPADMMRHIVGEDLNVGCVLSWGPCWYTQKQYFEGKVSHLSRPDYLMRYDVEVSGFPSSHCGHVCLLRLKEDDYPGTTRDRGMAELDAARSCRGPRSRGRSSATRIAAGVCNFPTTCPNGKREVLALSDPRQIGPVAQPTHCPITRCRNSTGSVPTNTSSRRPTASAISSRRPTRPRCGNSTSGTTRSTADCARGSAARPISPASTATRVGLGRVYVKMRPEERLDYDTWILGVRDGRSYCGDGRSHVFDFKVNDVALGEAGSNGKISQLNLEHPGKVKVTFDVAARLEEKPTEETERIRHTRLDQKPYWHSSGHASATRARFRSK